VRNEADIPSTSGYLPLNRRTRQTASSESSDSYDDGDDNVDEELLFTNYHPSSPMLAQYHKLRETKERRKQNETLNSPEETEMAKLEKAVENYNRLWETYTGLVEKAKRSKEVDDHDLGCDLIGIARQNMEDAKIELDKDFALRRVYCRSTGRLVRPVLKADRVDEYKYTPPAYEGSVCSESYNEKTGEEDELDGFGGYDVGEVFKKPEKKRNYKERHYTAVCNEEDCAWCKVDDILGRDTRGLGLKHLTGLRGVSSTNVKTPKNDGLVTMVPAATYQNDTYEEMGEWEDSPRHRRDEATPPRSRRDYTRHRRGEGDGSPTRRPPMDVRDPYHPSNRRGRSSSDSDDYSDHRDQRRNRRNRKSPMSEEEICLEEKRSNLGASTTTACDVKISGILLTMRPDMGIESFCDSNISLLPNLTKVPTPAVVAGITKSLENRPDCLDLWLIIMKKPGATSKTPMALLKELRAMGIETGVDKYIDLQKMQKAAPVPYFDATLPISIFLSTVEQSLPGFNIPKRLWVGLALSKLTGRAQTTANRWLNTFPSEKEDWDKFKEHMNTSLDKKLRLRGERELRYRFKKPSEDLQFYWNDVVYLADRGWPLPDEKKIADEMAFNQFIRGLPDAQRQHVYLQNPLDIHEAFQHALNFEVVTRGDGNVNHGSIAPIQGRSRGGRGGSFNGRGGGRGGGSRGRSRSRGRPSPSGRGRRTPSGGGGGRMRMRGNFNNNNYNNNNNNNRNYRFPEKSCTFCRTRGHDFNNCWKRNPNKAPKKLQDTIKRSKN